MIYDSRNDKLVPPKQRPFVANKDTPFYVAEGCTLCNAPETTAPLLIGNADEHGIETYDSDKIWSCFIKKQPSTEEELELMAEAMEGSCVACLRYRGTNSSIIEFLLNNGCSELCDAAPPE